MKTKILLCAVMALFGLSMANAQIVADRTAIGLQYGETQTIQITDMVNPISYIVVDANESTNLDLVEISFMDARNGGNTKCVVIRRVLRVIKNAAIKFIVYSVVTGGASVVAGSIIIVVEAIEEFIDPTSTNILTETLVAVKPQDWEIVTA